MKKIKITKTLPMNIHTDAVCKICLEGSSYLLNPCKCSGSMKYIHEDCLKTWILAKYSEIEEAKCEICSFQYTMESKISRTVVCNKEVYQSIPRCAIWPLLVVIAGLIILMMYLLIRRFREGDSKSSQILGILLTFLCGIACIIIFAVFAVLFRQLCTTRKLEQWTIFNYPGGEEHSHEATFVDTWKPPTAEELVIPSTINFRGSPVVVPEIRSAALSRAISQSRFLSPDQSLQLRPSNSENHLHRDTNISVT